MNDGNIAHRRMHNQRLADNPLESPESVVAWLGCVQSQDYGPAKWSVGERTRGSTDASIDQAFADGRILRTHVLRPTWHFVHPADIRWMVELTGPRVLAQMASRHRELGLTADVLRGSERLLEDALQGGRHLTRKELQDMLRRGGISVAGSALGHLMMSAELNGLVCSGPLKEKQHTYALLRERAPDARRLARDEGIGELVLRYFASHGPATLKDFQWWCGLTLADIRRGVEIVGAGLHRETHAGLTYYAASADPAPALPSPTVHLLQGYDEYLVAYTESRSHGDPAGFRGALGPRTIYMGVVVLDGHVAGHWKRTLTRKSVEFEVALRIPFNGARMDALHAAAHRQGAFLGLPATVAAVSV